jgi:toxin FitB
MNVVDSSGWIEYFFDSPRAELFATAIEERSKLLVPVVSIYEIHKVLSSKLPKGPVLACLDVMRQGRVLDLTDARAVEASGVARKHKLAMADAMMYSMAREFKATFWTQDVDYKGLPDVKYFAKK